MCERSHLPLSCSQLEHAIKRNFGGFEGNFDPFEIFRKLVVMPPTNTVRHWIYDSFIFINLVAK